jgi:hypothetical protein
MKARFFGALAIFSLLVLCATVYADVLSASFDLNHNGTNESTATSTFTQEKSGRWKIEDEVQNGTTGTFTFTWTPGKFSQNIVGTKTQTNRWTSWDKPNGSTTGSIVFTPIPPTDNTWGGTFVAQKWTLVPHAALTGADVGGELIDGSAATGTTLVLCNSRINVMTSPGYVYVYSVTNYSSSPISFTWAGFSATINPGATWSNAIYSPSLAGPEVWDTATVTFNPGTQNATAATFVAIYWTKPS